MVLHAQRLFIQSVSQMGEVTRQDATLKWLRYGTGIRENPRVALAAVVPLFEYKSGDFCAAQNFVFDLWPEPLPDLLRQLQIE
jgi:hypothetical protein